MCTIKNRCLCRATAREKTWSPKTVIPLLKGKRVRRWLPKRLCMCAAISVSKISTGRLRRSPTSIPLTPQCLFVRLGSTLDESI